MENTKIKPPLDRLALVAGELALADEAPGLSVETLENLAEELASIHMELEREWVHASTDGEVPTVAQGIALARFLRPHFTGDKSHWGAFVSRGGAGLGDSYLHVRFNDGYEGGIAKDGSTST